MGVGMRSIYGDSVAGHRNPATESVERLSLPIEEYPSLHLTPDT